jgi:hypothetical protein
MCHWVILCSRRAVVHDREAAEAAAQKGREAEQRAIREAQIEEVGACVFLSSFFQTLM